MTATTATPSIDLVGKTATQADAQIMLQLSQLATNPVFGRGMSILYADDTPMTFAELNERYPRSEPDFGAVMSVLQWYETIGTLVKNGLFDRALTYDWLLVHGMWDRCAGIATGQREAFGEPALWENFEALAEGQRGT